MKTYSINYDLSNPGRDYTDLILAIKRLGAWCHPVESSWLVNTDLSAIQIRAALQRVTDGNDKLIVFSVGMDGAWSNMQPDAAQWLATSWYASAA